MADVYHVNFKSQEFRPSRPSNSIRFMAASDAAAAAVAAELGNWTTGQQTSLTKNIGGDGFAGPYPEGTRRSVSAHVVDDTGAVSRVRFRNVAMGITADDIVALLTGVTSPGGAAISALSGPPSVPGGGTIVSVASVTFNILS